MVGTGGGVLYAYERHGVGRLPASVECGCVRKTRGMGSTVPVAVKAPEPPFRRVPEEVRGISSERAEAQPSQRRSHYPHRSAAFNPAVPADCLKEQIDQQQSRALPPYT